MNSFPAIPGTHLLVAYRDADRLVWQTYRVVGWCFVQGNVAFPLTAVNPRHGENARRAVEHPDKTVSCNVTGRDFENLEDWLDDVAKWLKDRDKTPAPIDYSALTTGHPDPAKAAYEAQAKEAMRRLRDDGVIVPAAEDITPEPAEPSPAPEKPKRGRRPKAAPEPLPPDVEDLL